MAKNNTSVLDKMRVCFDYFFTLTDITTEDFILQV